MIKIVYDHQIFGLQQYGGISRYFFELVRHLGKLPDLHASIIAPLHVNRYLAEAPLDVTGIRIPLIPKSRHITNPINRRMSAAFIRRKRPDLVHETYYQMAAYPGVRFPTIITVYDMIHEKFHSEFDPRDVTSAAKRAAVNRADHVICISENTRKDLIDLFAVDPRKTTTIHLGFSMTHEQSPAPAEVTKRPYLLFVGQRNGYKNFMTLLRAYGASPRVRDEWDLVAFGGPAFSREEKAAIAEGRFRADQVVHLTGDDGLLKRCYQNASALVYPSFYEGFGIPPLEAMSFGCPVICSNTSSIPEVVGDGGLYFEPDRVDSLVHGLESLLDSEELRLDVVKKGSRRVAQFSYERCALETMAVYKAVLSRPTTHD